MSFSFTGAAAPRRASRGGPIARAAGRGLCVAAPRGQHQVRGHLVPVCISCLRSSSVGALTMPQHHALHIITMSWQTERTKAVIETRRAAHVCVGSITPLRATSFVRYRPCHTAPLVEHVRHAVLRATCALCRRSAHGEGVTRRKVNAVAPETTCPLAGRAKARPRSGPDTGSAEKSIQRDDERHLRRSYDSNQTRTWIEQRACNHSGLHPARALLPSRLRHRPLPRSARNPAKRRALRDDD